GVRRLDETSGEPVDDPRLAPLRKVSNPFTLAEDRERNLWMNSNPPQVALHRADGSYDPELRALVSVPSTDLQTFYPESDGVMWLGGEKGLARYAGAIDRRGEAPPAPLIRRVTLAGELLVGEDRNGPAAAPALPPHARRLRIEFAPAAYRVGLRYQYRLDPADREWSRAQAEPFAEFTNLSAGDYALWVRTVDAGGVRSPETAWHFSVRQAWYMTVWAWALWLLLAAAILLFYAWLRTRALAQRAARLEAQVAAKTEELSQSLTELREAQAQVLEKNRLLESANLRLQAISLHDELTGIANRRHLQNRMAEEWRRGVRHRQSLAFVLFDLDQFKRLNDSLGHGEGDRALRRVGEYLAATVQRHGDVVARYGGEEFALLLPNTALDGALRVAEQLREGITGLRIAIDPAGGAFLTASFGVSASVPGSDESADGLVEAADAALYRAKAEGRNRVRSFAAEA
ncbi:MAG: diguanylate cyclase, partial [Acidobacteriota bacterium]